MNDINKKPRLFHGSPHRLAVIEPHETGLSRLNFHDPEIRGKYVFAQPAEIVAYAYALKTKANFTTSFNGRGCYIIISPERGGDWEAGLTKTERGLGGYIYEVNADAFEKSAHGEEWLSTQPQITNPDKTRFVTVNDCMEKGVQIFVISNTMKYSCALHWWEGHAVDMLRAGVGDNGIRWLNKECAINPIMPPGRPGPVLQITGPKKHL